MIVVTGAAGFIGSCMVRKLNDEDHQALIVVDEFSRADKNRNLENKKFEKKIDRADFLDWLEKNTDKVEFVYHLGARTDTTEQDVTIFDELNLNYSKTIWSICSEAQIPLVYASSAATYGLGELGYDDRHDLVKDLKPLNPYGRSKNDFDIWALEQSSHPPFWAGMKFFNVYGPNEYHKGRMASVIFHTVRQIKATGGMKLFRSHRSDFEDGQQSRDFVYIKDVIDVLYFFQQQFDAGRNISGLYNLGTGKARSFWDLAGNTFKAMDLEPNISFIDTPADIRDTYQYFTEANMEKLKDAGYQKDFYSLEEGIEDYVRKYLIEEKIY
jgi:ADP-L-glycero-D-manno-heptose 6-epimerase